MKRIFVALTLAFVLPATAEESKQSHSKPPREAPAPVKIGASHPKHPGQARTDHNPAVMDKYLAEIQRLIRDGRWDEANTRMGAMQKEFANPEPAAKPGPPHRPTTAPERKTENGRGKSGPQREDFARYREEIVNLRREGRHDEANRRIQEIHQKVRGKVDDRNHPPFHQGGRRQEGSGEPDRREGSRGDAPAQDFHAKANHLREAAEHLRAAGMNQEAEHFKSEAEKLQQASQSRQQPGNVSPDLNRRLEALEKSVQSLAKQLEAIGSEMKRRES